MEKVIKEWEYFRSWLVFQLCAVVGGMVFGAVSGMLVGGFLGAAGYDVESIRLICGGIGFVVGLILSYIMFRLVVAGMIVNKAQDRSATAGRGLTYREMMQQRRGGYS